MQESMHLLKISKKLTTLLFALLCDHITPKNHEKKALQTIKDFALQTSHKKGLRYEYQKIQILYCGIAQRKTLTQKYIHILTECGMSEDAIRKIIIEIKYNLSGKMNFVFHIFNEKYVNI